MRLGKAVGKLRPGSGEQGPREGPGEESKGDRRGQP